MKTHKLAILLLITTPLIFILACNGTTTQVQTTPTAIPSPVSTADWIGPDGETAVEHVPLNGGYWCGADGHRIELITNLSATDPSWEALLAFLQLDQTDKNLYNLSTFKNADYAEMLYNNAEAAGIKAATVSIELNYSCRSWYFLINAFNVTDRGLVYIDDSGVDKYCGGDCHLDKMVAQLRVDQPLHTQYLFNHIGWYTDNSDWGDVRNISIQWCEEEYEFVPIGGYETGADGHLIQLINNPQAHDPSWQELKDFLEQDGTDTFLYDSAIFVCTDYAEMLHNNAEASGIRAAFITIKFVNESGGHALNAFNTSDMGLVYIDDTGGYSHQQCSGDKEVLLELDEEYNPTAIFSCAGGSFVSIKDSWGEVSAIYTQW
jgi:hypothetical protein